MRRRKLPSLSLPIHSGPPPVLPFHLAIQSRSRLPDLGVGMVSTFPGLTDFHQAPWLSMSFRTSMPMTMADSSASSVPTHTKAISELAPVFSLNPPDIFLLAPARRLPPQRVVLCGLVSTMMRRVRSLLTTWDR